MLQLHPLSNIEPARSEFVLKNYIPLPKYAVTLLASFGGVGKTTLALQLACKFVQSEGRNVALWLTEDYPGQVRNNFDRLADAGLVEQNTMERIHLILNEPPQLAKKERGIFMANYEEISKIAKSLITSDVGFAVFDPLLAFYGGNENDNSEARVFIQAFAEWAKRANITTLMIHHAAKGSSGDARGARAFVDGVRCAYRLDNPLTKSGEVDEYERSKGYRKITLIKDNWGAIRYFKKLSGGGYSAMIRVTPPMEIDVVEVPYVA